MTDISIREDKKEILNFKIDLINKRHQEGSLITLLQSAQDSYGYVPEKVIHYISELVGIPSSEIYGVLTFYSQFRLKPMGKNIIRICEGTACHVNGAKTVLSVLQDELGISVDETTDDGLFTLQSVACLGCCSLAPVMMINQETHGNLTTEKIKKVIKSYKSNQHAGVTNEKN
ncbi:MAG: NADH-quinone oxidoreductase subunit NuoE [Ignavibacteriales bacterium]|jgi:NADH-quinone oxidoreductase subunit E|nr:MAG: NADH-quinone oxidoreductase subunit NuoE [Ignavibacteriales bacterium]